MTGLDKVQRRNLSSVWARLNVDRRVSSACSRSLNYNTLENEPIEKLPSSSTCELHRTLLALPKTSLRIRSLSSKLLDSR